MKLQSLAAVAALSTAMATCLFAGSAFADGRIAVALESPGRVAAFGGETKSLDADDLTRCNVAAKSPVQTAQK
jgi:hypothetical protein